MPTVHIDEVALTTLRNSLSTAGEEYLASYQKFSNLMDNIKKGTITGQPADRIYELYEAKRSTFDGVARTIEEAKNYMGMKNTQFGDMVHDLHNTFK